MIAEYANFTGDGKLNLMGVTDRLYAYQFPAIHRDLVLVNSIESDNDESNTIVQLLIQLIDPDGRVVTELKGELEVGPGKQVFHQIHVFQDINFQAPGSYQMNLFFDGQVADAIPLELVLLPPQTP